MLFRSGSEYHTTIGQLQNVAYLIIAQSVGSIDSGKQKILGFATERDLFALGASFRSRSDADCILLFKNAIEENAELAIKCLFYIADCRGGQGERRFFRVCYSWLIENYPDMARRNMELIPMYRRWDDVIYSFVGTSLEKDMVDFIKKQLMLDMESQTPSLLGKWMPSENASAKTTKKVASDLRDHLRR